MTQIPAVSELVPEITLVDVRRVWCDGSGDIRSGPGFRSAALGHPRVWLQIDERGFVDCGYCDRRFILENGPAHRDDGSGQTDDRTLNEVEPGHLSDEEATTTG